MDLVIDRLGEEAERAPRAPLLPRSALTNSQAWTQSGAVASWLIAQGFGPNGRSLAITAHDSDERTILLLGALRAGALVVEAPAAATLTFVIRDGGLVTPEGVSLAAMARSSIDASVAERRLHISVSTAVRVIGGICRRHGDFATIAEAVAA